MNAYNVSPTNKKYLSRYSDNILYWYSIATAEDIQAGYNWYAEAFDFTYELSKKYNLPLRNTAAIVATLSINTSWNENKIRAINYLNNPGLTAKEYKDRKLNVGMHKWLLRLHENYYGKEAIVTGLKVTNFFGAILTRGGGEHITIDRHAFRAYRWKTVHNGLYKYSVSKIDILIGILAYKKAAKIIGIPGDILQAIVWIVIRKAYGIAEFYG